MMQSPLLRRLLLLPSPPLALGAQQRGVQLSPPLQICIVERWWKIPLSKEGREPRMKHPRYKIYRLIEDTKHLPKQPLELILTQTVEDLGSRGDVVFVDKAFGRYDLLAKNRAVYASPENRKLFEEENRLRQEGKLPKLQTHTAEKTLRYLQRCTLEIGVNDCEGWELTPEIVARHFLRNLGVAVSLHALTLPEEPITELGDYWCEVTVNGLETVKVPISVVQHADPKPLSFRQQMSKLELEDTPTL